MMGTRATIFGCCLGVGVFLAAGCKKKEAAEASSPSPPPSPEAAAQPAPAAAAQAPPAPVSVQASWRESEEATKKKDYETAAAGLLKVYVIAPQLSEKEAQENFKRMLDLQKQIADASARGDPSAQRAFKMMSDVHEASRRRR
jgi:hypothetical protein